MGKLTKVIVLLALLWSGWWFGASVLLERAMTDWLADRRAQGWQAQADVALTGFPLRFNAALSDLALTDPETGVAIETARLDIGAPAYWPGDLTVTLPETPMRFVSDGNTAFVIARNGAAMLQLHPGTALELERLHATADAWQINTPNSNLLSAEDLSAEITQTETAETYRFALTAGQLAPGDLLRQVLMLPEDWPRAFDSFAADLTLRFDAPLDRFTLEDRRPQPRDIRISQISAQWGPVGLNAVGALNIDAQGVPAGTLTVVIENWRRVLDLAERGGAMPASMRPQAELMLNALANLGDDPDRLDLRVRFEDGNAFLGPIALGPAPRLILR